MAGKGYGTMRPPMIRIRSLPLLSQSVCLLLLSIGGAAFLSGCGVAHPRVQTKTDFVLDTACTISLYDSASEGTLTRAFALLRRVNERMTIDGTDSELIEVNRAAGEHPVKVSQDTFDVAVRGLAYSRLTAGAFDVTVGPLVKLWAIGRGGNTVPPADQIARARSLVDYRDLTLDETSRTIFLRRKGMMIDLGGIAKGWAGESVRHLLEREGVHRALVDLGGNIVAMGRKPDGSPWRIGIQDPNRPRGSYVGIVSVVDRAVVTSGKYERSFTYEGKRYHHILSTRTGFPVENGIASVTIVSVDSTDADALSTSLFVLGIPKAIGLVDSLKDTEAIILSEDKKVYVSGGLEGAFRITDPEYSLASPISVG